MLVEKLYFPLKGDLHRDSIVDIFLCSIYNTNIAQFQVNLFI